MKIEYYVEFGERSSHTGREVGGILLYHSINQSIKTHLHSALCRERIRASEALYGRKFLHRSAGSDSIVCIACNEFVIKDLSGLEDTA